MIHDSPAHHGLRGRCSRSESTINGRHITEYVLTLRKVSESSASSKALNAFSYSRNRHIDVVGYLQAQDLLLARVNL